MNKKFINKTIKEYKKILSEMQEKNLDLDTFCTDYFIKYLEYIRDLYLLSIRDDENPNENFNFLTLCAALHEYAESKDCIKKYFFISKYAPPQRINIELTQEETQEAFQKESAEHRLNFWKYTTAYTESWKNLLSEIKIKLGA